ncbi:cyanophycinase [Legionella genomosp. 1]|uniref:cyanophycinase n=1 Tax=Legionella genomosp. 1 TaxID=1093625 RepID=UPI001054B733|nr:cyanophycinase [Legionella genomosp. 1]
MTIGKLMFIGGAETQTINESKNSEKYRFELLEELFSELRIETLEVITTPSKEFEKMRKKYSTVFDKITGTRPHFIILGDDRPEHYRDRLENADAVFFTGGNQEQVLDLMDNELVQIISQRYHEDKLIVAGTSAGAMILADQMICEGGNEASQVDDHLKTTKAIGLLAESIIDTHFIQRGRFARLAHAVKRFPGHMGYGIEENAALLIENGNHASCYGGGTLTIIDGRKLQKNDYNITQELSHEFVLNLKVHLLIKGCQFRLPDFDQVHC